MALTKHFLLLASMSALSLACSGNTTTISAQGTGGAGTGGTSGDGGTAGAGGEGPDKPLPGSTLFTDDQVLEVRLTLAPADWTELEEHGDKEEYVPAAVELSGAGFEDVSIEQIGMRHKGAYSLHHCWDENGGVRNYEGECAKLSLNLKFDNYDDNARFDGLKRLNLHASSGDASKLREFLGYETYAAFGVDAPRAVPARVFINGEVMGLYIAVEEIDGRYTKAHFPDGGDGNLYKEVWPRAEIDDAQFVEALESNEEIADVSGMRAFADAVDSSTEANFLSKMEGIIDLDNVLRYMAVDRATKNWDGITAFYSPLMPHNYYFYQDSSDDPRFHLIPWDLDNVFWQFDPYMYPQDWVTAAPIPDWNSKPNNCQPRSVWDVGGDVKITPPRCDPFLDLLALTSWDRFVELGNELISGPLSASALSTRIQHRRAQIDSIVAEDPFLDYAAWQAAVTELSTFTNLARTDFQAFLGAGLIEEEPLPDVSLPPEVLNAETTDTGLIVSGVTNFEYAAAPPQTEPTGLIQSGDGTSSFLASWNTTSPLSGNADLMFEFTFVRQPGTYNEWVDMTLPVLDAGGLETEVDVSAATYLVLTLSADKARPVRIRANSPAYADTWGGIWTEFGVDVTASTTPQTLVLDLRNFVYPQWAKDPWEADQGFSIPASEALEVVLERFSGLIFAPTATFDAAGDLATEEEPGFVHIDNIYFH